MNARRKRAILCGGLLFTVALFAFLSLHVGMLRRDIWGREKRKTETHSSGNAGSPCPILFHTSPSTMLAIQAYREALKRLDEAYKLEIACDLNEACRLYEQVAMTTEGSPQEVALFRYIQAMIKLYKNNPDGWDKLFADRLNFKEKADIELFFLSEFGGRDDSDDLRHRYLEAIYQNPNSPLAKIARLRDVFGSHWDGNIVAPALQKLIDDPSYEAYVPLAKAYKAECLGSAGRKEEAQALYHSVLRDYSYDIFACEICIVGDNIGIPDDIIKKYASDAGKLHVFGGGCDSQSDSALPKDFSPVTANLNIQAILPYLPPVAQK